eukprot:2184657-Karenia_brevis.AAC.1
MMNYTYVSLREQPEDWRKQPKTGCLRVFENNRNTAFYANANELCGPNGEAVPQRHPKSVFGIEA